VKIRGNTAQTFAAVALAAVSMISAGCSVTTTSPPAAGAQSAEQGGDEGTANGSGQEAGGAGESGTDESGGRLPTWWPDKEFPLPRGGAVKEVNDPADGERGIAITGVNPDEVLDFYRKALPAAGYEITKDKKVGIGGLDVGGMEFSGNGWAGEIGTLGRRNAVLISTRQD
jgi:hypothetical protein